MREGYEHMFKADAAELKPGLTPEFCAEMTVAMVSAMSLSLLECSEDQVRSKTGMLLSYIQQSMLQKRLRKPFPRMNLRFGLFSPVQSNTGKAGVSESLVFLQIRQENVFQIYG